MRKIDLNDVTFVIPFYRDSEERFENLKCVLRFINDNFDTNICISEVGTSSVWAELDISGCHTFEFREDGLFHRTKVINDGIKHPGVKTPFIAIYDTDVVFDPDNIFKAVKLLRSGVTLVYPYGGEFVDIKRSYIKDGVIIEKESFTSESVGGACFINKKDYWECGLEVEYYKNWCPDDVTRRYIIETMGYKTSRVDGKCYHISHPPSQTSGVNIYTETNNKIWDKIRSMNKKELILFIRKFEWLK